MDHQLQDSLFIIKPDAQPVRQRILEDLLSEGYELLHLTQTRSALEPAIWEQHYEEHRGKDFFDNLIGFQGSGPVTIAIVRRDQGIRYLRRLIGATDLRFAKAGTIRHAYREWALPDNPASTLVHASDSPESAEREIALWTRICGWPY